jgi:hypothetical protein
VNENFGTWLFDPSYADFSVTHLPFLEGGLESIFNSHIHYDMESLTSSRSQLETPPHVVESDELISEYRRQEMLKWFLIFCQKPRSEQLSASLRHDGRGEFPTLSLDKFKDCLQEWWQVGIWSPHRLVLSPNRVCSMWPLAYRSSTIRPLVPLAPYSGPG